MSQSSNEEIIKESEFDAFLEGKEEGEDKKILGLLFLSVQFLKIGNQGPEFVTIDYAIPSNTYDGNIVIGLLGFLDDKIAARALYDDNDSRHKETYDKFEENFREILTKLEKFMVLKHPIMTSAVTLITRYVIDHDNPKNYETIDTLYKQQKTALNSI